VRTKNNDEHSLLGLPFSFSTMVMAEEGLFVWGQNNEGQLGLGDNQNRTSPVKNNSLSQIDVRGISCCFHHTLATTNNGELLVWGDMTAKKIPERVNSMSNEEFVQVSAGPDFSLALTSKGRIFSEGNNSQGQLGQGDTEHRKTLIEITSIPTKITSHILWKSPHPSS
jgi:alpha-tubulin suppressor-like RCC1 family protein